MWYFFDIIYIFLFSENKIMLFFLHKIKKVGYFIIFSCDTFTTIAVAESLSNGWKLGGSTWDTTKGGYVCTAGKINMNKYNACMRSYMHLLMIPCLMVLCDIPSDTDNWGWINDFELKIYDFSTLTMAFSHTADLTKDNMHIFWKRHIDPQSSEESFETLISCFAKDETHLFHPASHKKLKKMIEEARSWDLWMDEHFTRHQVLEERFLLPAQSNGNAWWLEFIKINKEIVNFEWHT